MNDDNFDMPYDDFDSELVDLENEVYETEVDNQAWINGLITGIDLD